MGLNLFLKSKAILEEKKFDIDLDKLINFLGKYHQQEWIYASDIIENFNLDKKAIYEILKICSDNGIVKPYIKVLCPKCNKVSKQCYSVIADIPKKIKCSHCDNNIGNPFDYCIVIYKVI